MPSAKKKYERCTTTIGIEDGPDGSFTNRKFYIEFTPVDKPHEAWRIYIPVDQYQQLMDNSAGRASASIAFSTTRSTTTLEFMVRLYHDKK